MMAVARGVESGAAGSTKSFCMSTMSSAVASGFSKRMCGSIVVCMLVRSPSRSRDLDHSRRRYSAGGCGGLVEKRLSGGSGMSSLDMCARSLGVPPPTLTGVEMHEVLRGLVEQLGPEVFDDPDNFRGALDDVLDE